MEIFDWANTHSSKAAPGVLFDVEIVGITSTIELYGRKCALRTCVSLADSSPCETVIIPAFAGNIAEAVEKNCALIPWLLEQYAKGSQLAGLCTGAFFFSKMNLLRDASCRKTWFVDQDFRQQYSHVESVAGTTLQGADSIHSDGGAYSFIFELIEECAGFALAARSAIIFQAIFNQAFQSVFSLSPLRRALAEKVNPPAHNSINCYDHCENLLAQFELMCSRRLSETQVVPASRPKNSAALKTFFKLARNHTQ